MVRPVSILAALLLLGVGCDRIGRENAVPSAVPDIAPPLLSPVEIKPPRIARAPTGRVEVVDPPRVDATQIDVLQQSDGIVDILWVLDDSGSMANERRRLINNFNRFIDELERLGVNFQLGVTSLSAQDQGRLRGTTKIIRNTTPNPRAVFEANATFAESRNRWEQGLRMTQLALSAPNTAEPNGPNAGFIRASAALAVIVVTNEDDSSFGTTDYFARAFRGLKGKGNEQLVSFSVIGGTTPNGCIPPGEDSFYGSLAEPSFRYSEVAVRTGGIVGSICDSTFEQTLTRIAQALNTLKRVFPLTIVPLLSSLRVTVDGTAVPNDAINGYQYRADTNSVVFLGTYVPPPGSTVRIEYAFSRT